MAGDYETPVNFGCGSSSYPGSGIFLARLGSVGTCVWDKPFQTTGPSSATAVTTDDTGNVIITGAFSGSIEFAGQIFTADASSDVFLGKFNSSGDHLWSKRVGGPSMDDATGVITYMNTGNLVFAGSTRGSLDFGTGPLVPAGMKDVVIAKLAP